MGRELNSGETERELWKRITAWAINLTVGQIFKAGGAQIILGLIKMNIKIISKNLDGIIFLFSRHSDFSSVRQTTDMPQNISQLSIQNL